MQKETCRIFQVGGARFVGVCNSRTPPDCNGDPERSDNPGKVTITIVVESKAVVRQWHEYLLPLNGTAVRVTEPGESVKFGAYAFNAYDTNWKTGLGCYRWEVQYFSDPSWPETSCKVDVAFG